MADPRTLAAQHLDLARKIARQMRRTRQAAEHDEVQSAAYLGLVEAARSYRASRGASFVTFATPRIRGAVLDWMRSVDPLSRDMREQNREIEETRRDLTVSLGRPPVEIEMAQALGVTLEKYQRQRMRCAFPRHIRPYDEEIISSVPCPRPWGEPWLAGREARRALAALPRRLRTVARAYYLHDRLLGDIGRELGVTESRACQLLREATQAMRERWSEKEITQEEARRLLSEPEQG